MTESPINPLDFTVVLADIRTRIQALHPSTREFLKDYLVDDEDKGAEPEVDIAITQEDIDFERIQSAKQNKLDGIDPPINYSDAYLETIAILRKAANAYVHYGVLLFHGSCIAVDDQAYLFTARSGVGKSTHARFWREQLGDRAFMVNDDKPFLRCCPDGRIMAYGTPWDGKHRLSTKCSRQVRAIAVLSRAKEGCEASIREVSREDAFPSIMFQGFRSDEPEIMSIVLGLDDAITRGCKLFGLKTTLDPACALMAFEAMGK